ncbi:hypothetical protein [Gordonia sp. KTR9]|uniref:hypothetical protein n=1 Tax=Gordonia sp. KTR9 TaxID=337191 RepID=UPI00027DE39B|nr:hypothetical protein [Gordonia sp. KTR9]AFR51436.1 hypothetical protein KTR9_4977 [Gordonia sp. KTR9]
MIHAGEAIERIIEERWGATLAAHRSHIGDRLASNDVFDENFKLTLREVRAPTFTNQSLDIRLDWAVYDPSQSATFPTSINPRLIILFLSFHQVDDSDYSAKRWQHTTVEEQEAWVYSALGKQWFDYAYRIQTSRSLVRYRPTRFVVFADDAGEPFLAPEDFNWMLASGNDPSVRLKLRPRHPTHELEQALLTVGDVTSVPGPT